jgi:threonine synthase
MHYAALTGMQKDVALQFLGNLFEFFLVRRNSMLKQGEKRHHLTIVGATSGGKQTDIS